MLRKKKQTEITLERRERLVVRQRGTFPAWCAVCERSMVFISVDASAAIAGSTVREIFRRIEAGDLHFLETLTGQIFVCPASLDTYY